MFMLRFPLNKVYSSSIWLQYSRCKPTLRAAVYYRLSSNTSYIVLIPEVPDDTAATNPLLKDTGNLLPGFIDLDADKCFKGIGRHALDHEAGAFEIERNVEDAPESVTYDNVIGELEKLDARLTFAWGTARNFYSVNNDKITSSCYKQIRERAKKALAFKYGSRPIYEACKKIKANEANLDTPQKRAVGRMLLEAKLNGVDLVGEKYEAFHGMFSKLKNLEEQYRRKLQISSERFSYRIIDYGIVKNFPEDLLKKMADNSSEHLRGPWTVTHNQYVYQKFMEHCPHKDLRFNAWRAYVTRASRHLDEHLNNGLTVTEIRDQRHHLAKHLGYETFADMSLETKMAASVDDILALINTIFTKANEQQLAEVNSLREFAEKCGFRGELEECDVPYWRRKQRLDISNWKEADMESHFPFSHVWSQLLSLCSNLFDVHFEDVTSQVETWHPDVLFYNVVDSDGKKISAFYIDPFERPEKVRVGIDEMELIPLKGRCDTIGGRPLASIIFNFKRPSPQHNKQCLLSFEDVQKLFKLFGYTLQHLLSTVPYHSVSGLSNMEWDVSNSSTHFLYYWLHEPSVLEKISKHYISGSPLSKEGIRNFITALSHMNSYDLCQSLFLSHMDIKFHTEDTVWYEIQEELWEKYVPFKCYKKNSLPCWFSPIMSEGWPAAYYSDFWSKMVAADAFRAFKECDPHDVTVVGKRYRETFLSSGGGCHAAEVFRKFRGRDPVSEALLTVLGIS